MMTMNNVPLTLCPNNAGTFDALRPDDNPLDAARGKLLLAQGYGATAGLVPLRTLSYSIPVMQALQALPGSQAELYFATEASIRANPGLDADAVRAHARQAEAFIMAYLSRRHPEHVDRVRMLEDERLVSGVAVDLQAERLTDALESALPGLPDYIKNFVRRRGGRRALRCIAEHVLFMRDPILIRGVRAGSLIPQMSRTAKHVVMIGGPAEKLFYTARQILLSSFGRHQDWQSTQLFTPLAARPANHHQHGEPHLQEFEPDFEATLRATLERVSAEHATNRQVARDLLWLAADASGDSDVLRQTIEATKARTVRREPLGELAEPLQRGWDMVCEVARGMRD